MKIWFCIVLVLVLLPFTFGQQNKSSKTMAETFQAVSMDGQTFDLEALRGKVVVMTFWSTRCPICISEIPKLNKMVDNYRGKDVVFLALTADNSAKVEVFLKNKTFKFNVLPDSFGILYKYADKDGRGNMNMGFPSYFLVNQSGEIELKVNGWDKIDDLNSKINRLLSSGQMRVE